MASWTMEIDNAVAQSLINAICSTYGYQEKILDPQDPTKEINNPETKAQFSKGIVKNFLKEVYIGYKINIAKDAAQTTAESDAETEITNKITLT